MKVLDTDLLVAVLRGKEDAKKALEAVSGDELFASSISIFELYFGAFISQRKQENLRAVENLASSLTVLDLDFVSSKLAAGILAELRTTGSLIGLKDCLIAGTCLKHNAELLSRNISEFSRVRNLKVRKW
ncbi:MAG: type II toxin-antitoxin system VapC family toxin [Candidatus Micrarchaeota archaeon]